MKWPKINKLIPIMKTITENVLFEFSIQFPNQLTETM